jgi:hypothetical protein
MLSVHRFVLRKYLRAEVIGRAVQTLNAECGLRQRATYEAFDLQTAFRCGIFLQSRDREDESEFVAAALGNPAVAGVYFLQGRHAHLLRRSITTFGHAHPQW